MQVFPTWRYHVSAEPVCVNSAEELKALGPGWADSPAAFEKKSEEAPEVEEKEEQKPKRGKAK